MPPRDPEPELSRMPLRILHITHNTPGRNAKGGGLVFAWQNITALAQLGHEVHMVIAEPNGTVDDDLREACASVTYGVPVTPAPWQLVDRAIDRVFRPETVMFRLPGWKGIREQMLAAVERVRPDLIWADWIGSLMRVPDGIPVVYGHLDFLYQLQRVRKKVHAGRVRRPDILSVARLEAIERGLVRQRAAHAVTVSATDEAIFDELDVPSTYMPVVGAPIPAPQDPPPAKARAFLLGRSNTAMNAARKNLREKLWPVLGERSGALEWHQLGEVPSQKSDDWRWVEDHFHLHGYVESLGDVLRPTDLCLVPYREDTGFRAKFVTAAGYGMVNIGYEETFHCAEGFVPGVNCLAARDDGHFAELLERYARDEAWRHELSAASRALYDAQFGLAAQLPTYTRIVESALAHR